jgi:hypothetical protein
LFFLEGISFFVEKTVATGAEKTTFAVPLPALAKVEGLLHQQQSSPFRAIATVFPKEKQQIRLFSPVK